MSSSPDHVHATEPTRLWTRGYTGLMLSQAAGAINDNLIKGALLILVVAPNAWAGALGPAGTGWISFALTFPFIIFLGYAGQLADRFSKRSMVVIVRATELPIVLLIAAGFWIGSFWLTFGGFLLIATQSAFFNPPKWGMIREVSGTTRLSQANGLMVLVTNVAIIAALGIAGFLLDGGGWKIGVVMIVVAVVGFLTSLVITPLQPADPGRAWEWNPLGRYWRDFRAMRGGPLYLAVWAWGFFYFIAIMVISIIPDLQKPLGVSTGALSMLLGAAALGIGIGCAIAGFCSGTRIRVGMVPWGAAGLVVAWLLLGLLPLAYVSVLVLLLLGGFSAGFFIVPLQAMQQRLAPPTMRARYIGSANALCYVLMSIAALVYIGLIHLGLEPRHVFLVCSGCSLAMLVAMLLWPRALQFNESDYA